MNIALSEKRIFSIRSLGETVSSLLIFLYFFTSGGDKLHFHLNVFKGKLNNFFALALALAVILILKKIYLRATLLIPTIHFLFSLIISSFFSPYFSRSLGYTAVYIIEFFLYFLLSYNLIVQCNEKKILNLYFLAFWWVAIHAFLQLFFSIFGLMDPLVGQFIGRLARPHSFFYEPSFYALYLSAIVMYKSAEIMIDDDPRLLRKLIGSLFFIHFFFLISTSTGAFISYFFLIPILCAAKLLLLKRTIGPYFYKKLGNFTAGFVSLLAVLFAIIPNIFFTYFFKFFNASFMSHHSFVERWAGAIRAWEVFKQYPIFGRGVGGVGPHYYYAHHNVAEGTKLSLLQLEKYDPTNVFTEILGTLGLFGALAIGTFIYFFVKELRKLVLLDDKYRKEKIIAVSLILSWIIQLLVLQFNQGLFRNYIWIHSGIVLGYMHKLFLKAGVTVDLPWKRK